MRGGVAQRGGVFENNELLWSHRTARGGAVMVKHLRERLPEQREVIVAEAGLVGEVGADEAVAAIKAIGDEVLAAHRLVGRIGFLGVGDGHSSDAQVEWQDGVDAAAETDLHWTPNLAGIGSG